MTKLPDDTIQTFPFEIIDPATLTNADKDQLHAPELLTYV